MPAKKRETIDKGSAKRYVRRDARGRFTKDQVDAGRSSAADQRQHSNALEERPGRPGRPAVLEPTVLDGS
jgi:hypothetical protein